MDGVESIVDLFEQLLDEEDDAVDERAARRERKWKAATTKIQ